MLLLQNDDEAIKSAKIVLHNNVHNYRYNSWKMWVFIFFGLLILLSITGIIVKILSLVNNAKYDREGLESVAGEKFKNYTFDDVMQDELLITAFEFNSFEPRFYSKYFREIDYGIHAVDLKTAASASSSAPLYFDPTSHVNRFQF